MGIDDYLIEIIEAKIELACLKFESAEELLIESILPLKDSGQNDS